MYRGGMTGWSSVMLDGGGGLDGWGDGARGIIPAGQEGEGANESKQPSVDQCRRQWLKTKASGLRKMCMRRVDQSTCAGGASEGAAGMPGTKGRLARREQRAGSWHRGEGGEAGTARGSKLQGGQGMGAGQGGQGAPWVLKRQQGAVSRGCCRCQCRCQVGLGASGQGRPGQGNYGAEQHLRAGPLGEELHGAEGGRQAKDLPLVGRQRTARQLGPDLGLLGVHRPRKMQLALRMRPGMLGQRVRQQQARRPGRQACALLP